MKCWASTVPFAILHKGFYINKIWCYKCVLVLLPEDGVEDDEVGALFLANATEKALQLHDISNTLSKRSATSGAEFLAARSYQGLDMRSTLPEPYVIGRRGRAAGYEDEKLEGNYWRGIRNKKKFPWGFSSAFEALWTSVEKDGQVEGFGLFMSQNELMRSFFYNWLAKLCHWQYPSVVVLDKRLPCFRRFLLN